MTSAMCLKLGILTLAVSMLAPAQTKPTISIVEEGPLGPAAVHGLQELRDALGRKQYRVRTGSGQPHGTLPIFLHVNGNSTELQETESYSIRRLEWREKPALRVTAGGDRGMMYALLELSEKSDWSHDDDTPFGQIKDESEKPDVGIRAVSIYTMNQAYFESRFYDERYWMRYFDMLARNRFNTFVLVFGYENAGYFAPPYPYFFDVKGFSAVHVVGLTRERQARNLAALRRMIEIAHSRGINFTTALWDHIYRGGVQGPAELTDHPTPGVVQGVTTSNLTTYIPAAFDKFLTVCPDVDTIQFRMHTESGLNPSEMKSFWETMYQVMKRAPKRVGFEFRLKEFPDDLIQRAVDLGLNFRLETKYWAEQMGLPFHPTHIQLPNQFDRRHGYADVLRYPQEYRIGYRLWNGGTSRILLWGDPDYARRFAASTHLYDGAGFEVNEPLATKMERQPAGIPPFQLLNAPYRYYDYEFERYWRFFQVFGRLGYNPATSPEVFDREFQKRFGEQNGPLVEQALHRASTILPRIIAYCLPANLFPTTRGWPEKQRWDDLPAYAASTPSDTEQFESFRDAAEDEIQDRSTAKIAPQRTSEWFRQTASNVLSLVGRIDQSQVNGNNKELVSTITDLRILAALALYHANRIPAAINLELFQETHDLNALDDAIVQEHSAIDSWKKIILAAGDVYTSNLSMGLEEFDLTGHWKDELPRLQADVKAIERERDTFHLDPRRPMGRFVFGDAKAVNGEQYLPRHYASSIPLPNGSYELIFTIDGADTPQGYGPMWIEANGADYTGSFQVASGKQVQKRLTTRVVNGTLHIVLGAQASGSWRLDRMSVTRIDPVIAHVPIRRIQPRSSMVVRATIAAVGAVSARVVYGDRENGFRTVLMTTGDHVRYQATLDTKAFKGQMKYWIEATDEAGRPSNFPAEGPLRPVTVSITSDRDAPIVVHDAVTKLEAGSPLRLTARVSDVSGVRWVRLRYRAVSQHQDFRTIAMLPTGKPNEYQVELPLSEIDPRWDFMYLIEAMDNVGNGCIYPDLEKETPYVVVKRDRNQPTISAARLSAK